MSTFLLIHGGMQGGWCWERLAPYFEKEGHTVITPCLSGLGTKTHLHSPKINLSTHIQDVLDIIDGAALKNVIVVGHSYGGMVATGLAAQRTQAIKQVISLDAVLAQPGQSMSTAIYPKCGRCCKIKQFLKEVDVKSLLCGRKNMDLRKKKTLPLSKANQRRNQWLVSLNLWYMIQAFTKKFQPTTFIALKVLF